MPDRLARYLLWLLLMPLLPACSLIPAPQNLEGFSPDTLQLVRRQSAELDQLQQLDTATPAQQNQIKQLRGELQQFERDVIRTASTLEHQNDWHGAEQLLKGATRVLPDSQVLISAQLQLATRRQLREERVRMELEIHRGEQLLKDAEAYQRLQQLNGPAALTWLELKNYNRKRRASAQALHEYVEQAIAREKREDYEMAQRALKIARGLYGDDLQQDADLQAQLAQSQALLSRHLNQHSRQNRSRTKPIPAITTPVEAAQVPIAELQQALDTGDLPSARQYLEQLRQQSPQHPQLLPLQSQFQSQLDARVDAAIKRGNDLYSEGKIEQALYVWREASTLAPDNVQLVSNIARAENLLKNLRALTIPANAQP
ncbi:hypothetical protein M0G74_00380 [Microbulbifer sp. CAU 1566]|uniref:hypothetical protein n=1 Tax=Microbulbifer sp. CAU 1566 TaxID=2933269 RepID=UPI002003BB96|nr:hypothetical protein [Microbulbifer sp. CAU 1566]MCK7595719.1 hypothetical protein [Microbulbifer sp. CAU 1566]